MVQVIWATALDNINDSGQSVGAGQARQKHGLICVKRDPDASCLDLRQSGQRINRAPRHTFFRMRKLGALRSMVGSRPVCQAITMALAQPWMCPGFTGLPCSYSWMSLFMMSKLRSSGALPVNALADVAIEQPHTGTKSSS